MLISQIESVLDYVCLLVTSFRVLGFGCLSSNRGQTFAYIPDCFSSVLDYVCLLVTSFRVLGFGSLSSELNYLLGLRV